jgi:hypothetical protein
MPPLLVGPREVRCVGRAPAHGLGQGIVAARPSWSRAHASEGAARSVESWLDGHALDDAFVLGASLLQRSSSQSRPASADDAQLAADGMASGELATASALALDVAAAAATAPPSRIFAGSPAYTPPASAPADASAASRTDTRCSGGSSHHRLFELPSAQVRVLKGGRVVHTSHVASAPPSLYDASLFPEALPYSPGGALPSDPGGAAARRAGSRRSSRNSGSPASQRGGSGTGGGAGSSGDGPSLLDELSLRTSYAPAVQLAARRTAPRPQRGLLSLDRWSWNFGKRVQPHYPDPFSTHPLSALPALPSADGSRRANGMLPLESPASLPGADTGTDALSDRKALAAARARAISSGSAAAGAAARPVRVPAAAALAPRPWPQPQPQSQPQPQPQAQA